MCVVGSGIAGNGAAYLLRKVLLWWLLNVAGWMLQCQNQGGIASVSSGAKCSSTILLRTFQEYEVTLCEKDARTGGHAYTIDAGQGSKVDIGFQVPSPTLRGSAPAWHTSHGQSYVRQGQFLLSGGLQL